MEPESRRSDSVGTLLSRFSVSRLSWLSASTGICREMASCFRRCEMSVVSSYLFLPLSLEISPIWSMIRRPRFSVHLASCSISSNVQGESWMISGRFVSSFVAVMIRSHSLSSSLICPFKIASWLKPERIAALRAHSCSSVISRLMKRTVLPAAATLSPMFNTRLVFPIPGRPANVTSPLAISPPESCSSRL